MDIRRGGNSPLKEHTENLLKGGKKIANDLYEETRETAAQLGDNIKDYSGLVMHKVRERPIATSLFIGGLSLMVLAAFLRR
ncbi:hypothetical protein [Legionella clemsonensis]|uniref:DUF883 domain-containing protein n=1 Tax=Legionella clemsonensis TaxID=1867846 RepID=A0A222NYZ2_9GAMM|nr:hypothetical protein [Legionella clemsonensis]ASQ44796.1 hypothetical protein clem_01150 [Legionella clemsonensis]